MGKKIKLMAYMKQYAFNLPALVPYTGRVEYW